MAKVLTLDYVLLNDGQKYTIDTANFSAIVTARVRFRGEKNYETDLQHSTRSATGITSAIFPEVPAGYSFDSHSATANALVVNETSNDIQPTTRLNTPFGTFNHSVNIVPADMGAMTAFSGPHGSNHVGEQASITVLSDGGNVVYREVVAQTRGVREVVIVDEDTENPAVTVGEQTVQHTGVLEHGVESDWYDLDSLSIAQSSLIISVGGSYKVSIQLELIIEPLLPAPTQYLPTQGSRIDNRRPVFEFVIHGHLENSSLLFHARVRISSLSTMGSSATISSLDGGTWEYLDGDTWLPFPVTGVPSETRVRVTIDQELRYRTYYWDCAGHDGYEYGENSLPYSFRIMVAVTDVFGAVHNDEPITKITQVDASETCNGEIGEFTLVVDNKNGATNERINYGDIILLAVNDTIGNTEEFKGIVRVKSPMDTGLISILSKTGDGILGERLIKEDFPLQDIGLTAKMIIEKYCQPLTAGNINTNTGIAAPIPAMDKTAISVFEAIRQDYGVYYYVDKDWDTHFYLEDDIMDAVVQIQLGE